MNDCQGCEPKTEAISVSTDSELAKELRRDFTSRHCVEALMQAAAAMAAAIGVTVTWEIQKVDDIDVDRQQLSKALGQLATSGGAILAGGKINPITALHAQNPIRMIRERKRNV